MTWGLCQYKVTPNAQFREATCINKPPGTEGGPGRLECLILRADSIGQSSKGTAGLAGCSRTGGVAGFPAYNSIAYVR